MDNILNLTPVQAILVLLLEAWVIVIFPLLVIRKLNYLTELIESQVENDSPDAPEN